MRMDYFTLQEADDEDLYLFDDLSEEVSDTDLTDFLIKLGTFIQKEGLGDRAALLERAKQILNSKGLIVVYD